MAVSPDGRFLYAIHAPDKFGGESHEQIAAYEIVGRSGRLKLLNRESALGSAACYLDVDSSGKTVVVANYSSGSVASLPVREDGSAMKVIGASYFKYGGNYEWCEQLDMYDYTNITNLIKECVEKGILKEMPVMSTEQV